MNWTELDERIADLEVLANDALSGEGSWGDFWTTVKEIGSAFKEPDLRYPTRSDRSQAWSRFQSLISETKEAQRDRSAELRDELVGGLEAIHFPMGGIFSASADLVTGMFSAVAAGGVAHPESSEKTLLRMAGAELKDVRARYHETKRLLTREDNDLVWKRLGDCHDQLQRCWEACEETEAQIRVSRLQDAIRRKFEYVERLQDRRRRVEENVSANEDRLAEARSDEYRDRVETWIAEGREQLEEIDEKTEAAEAAIRDMEDKIRDL